MNPEKEIHISAQITPNPNSLQFYCAKELVEKGSYQFENISQSKGSGLPEYLFELQEIAGVLVGKDFVTVTKNEDVEWPLLAEKVIERLKTYLSKEQPVISASFLEKMQESEGSTDDISTQIKKIIDDEIRPAVARDGGDILFDSFEDGIVKLHLRGACSSCPSSVFTLKVGIENRLKQAIPEIKEVIAV